MKHKAGGGNVKVYFCILGDHDGNFGTAAHVYLLSGGNIEVYFCILGDYDSNVQAAMMISMLREHMYFKFVETMLRYHSVIWVRNMMMSMLKQHMYFYYLEALLM